MLRDVMFCIGAYTHTRTDKIYYVSRLDVCMPLRNLQEYIKHTELLTTSLLYYTA
jgi:hypothetical protein